MSFQTWVDYGWLKTHQSSPEEIGNLFGIIDRDLKDCEVPGLSPDARLERAYNAALQCATVALFASGYRASSRDNHYKVIESLEMTLQDKAVKQRLDRFRAKRNKLNYEMAGAVSDGEVEEMVSLAKELRPRVRAWLERNHPALLPPK
jgi:hypothetical protein